jgi:hypothetical protein
VIAGNDNWGDAASPLAVDQGHSGRRPTVCPSPQVHWRFYTVVTSSADCDTGVTLITTTGMRLTKNSPLGVRKDPLGATNVVNVP